jgi:hypothetical protein
LILLLNGAFGIGKTTVARRLRRRLPGSMIFDPEPIGLALLRLPLGPTPDDFQDLPAWRELTVIGIRCARLLSRTIIVPMAFTSLDYLEQVRAGAARADADVRHLCLVAPEAVVRGRLIGRGAAPAQLAWQLRRAAECCAVHGEAEFAEHVPTDGREPDAIATDIIRRLGA